MTVNQMKKVETLYHNFTALENSVDLHKAGLTLSDYNELFKRLQILYEGCTCITACENVKKWIESQVEVKVYESYGYYILELI